MNKLLIAIVLLLSVTSVQAQYDVVIDQEVATPGTAVDVSIRLQLNGTDDLLGAFDLTISYEASRLAPFSIVAGSYLNDRSWEYFTYVIGTSFYSECCINCPQVKTLHLIAIADMNNGAAHPSYEPLSGPEEIVKVSYFASGDLSLVGKFSPIDFYWIPSTSTCGENTFSSDDGNTLYGAGNAYDANGTLYNSFFNCSGPGTCNALAAEYDFYGGGVTFLSGDPTNRGDVNLNGLKWEPADAIVLTDYFILGLAAFTINVQDQVDATDTNCDGIKLSVADLVFLIRVMVGDASAGPPCATSSSGKSEFSSNASSVANDTITFNGASGYAGQTRVPFEISIANGQALGGLEARLEYNAAHLTPHFDPIIADGRSVEYSLVGRSVGFEPNGSVMVVSDQAGEVVIKFIPDIGDVDNSTIAAGSGVILRFYMDVNPPPILADPSPVNFVTSGYSYNLLADLYGGSIQPELVGNQFTFTPQPPRPSCPVLYSFDGSKFVQENPLLTACENSGYRESVVDYYHVLSSPQPLNGKIKFQLRELEDEITYLEDVQLLTVDHSINTRVASDANGTIFVYDGSDISPLTAIDQDGNDRLAEVISEDGQFFISRTSGSLTLTFPYSGETGGYGFDAAAKPRCFGKQNAENDVIETRQFKVEILDQNGQWIEYPSVPSRVSDVEEIVVSALPDNYDSDVITIRLGWEGSYATDVVRQLIQSKETAVVNSWFVENQQLLSGNENNNRFSNFSKTQPLVLRKGDIFEFSFDAGSLTQPEMTRDYLIVASGRYEPDYSVYPGLLPGTIELYDNFPNPFNPTTTISFSLPVASEVTLEIYNSLGQLVKTLVDGHKTAGHYRVEWNAMDNNGRGVSSGVYFYRLVTDKTTESKKMMILK